MYNVKLTQSHDTIRKSSQSVSHRREISSDKFFRIDHAALDYEGAPQPDEDFADYVSPRALRGARLA